MWNKNYKFNLHKFINPRIFYPLILASIAIYICFANYIPATWLSGWDTLHPEMNFSIYWNRLLNSVWQEHQGLGAVAAQAHSAEIPRLILMQLFSFIFPVHFLRWLYFFIMLVIGPLGVYFFFIEITKSEKIQSRRAYSFLAGAFYLLNLGTLQNFYVPLEMFATLYGLIGWLFIYVHKILKGNSKIQTYAIFCFLTILSTPMAHTPTLWFAYFALISFYVFIQIIASGKYFRNTLKRGLLIISTIFFLNIYWLLPTGYFILNQSRGVADAKITRLVSEEGILNNQEYANISDVSILKGYLFNWLVHRGDGNFSQIFKEWNAYYYYNPVVFYIGYTSFAFCIIGLLIATVRYKKNKNIFILALSVGFPSFFIIMMSSPPFGFIFDYIFSNSTLLKEALRFPYTKVSIFLIFVYSILFGYSFILLSRIRIKFLPHIISLIVCFLLAIYMLPAFKGDLFGDIVKVKIPESYFEAFEYLNDSEDSRILVLPIPAMYGWVYYDWENSNNKLDASYQGAGFSWFLSKNPIIEREFDRWYPTNEDLYNELHYAVYSNNIELFRSILKKYDISHVLLDYAIIDPVKDTKIYDQDFKSFLLSNSEITLDSTYKNLDIFVVQNQEPSEGYIKYFSDYSKIDGVYEFSNYDPIASSNYLSSDNNVVSNVLDDNSLANNFSNEILINEPSFGGDKLYLRLPDFSKNIETITPVYITNNGESVILKYIYPKILDSSNNVLYVDNPEFKYESTAGKRFLLNGVEYLNDSKEHLDLVKYKGNEIIEFSTEPTNVFDFNQKIYSAEVSDCLGGEGSFGKEIDNYPNSVEIKAYNKNTCLDFTEEFVTKERSLYKISFDYKSSQGANPVYCLSDTEDRNCLNDKYANAPLSAKDFTRYSDYVYTDSPKNLRLSLIIETKDKRSEQVVVFRNIKIEEYETFAISLFDSPVPKGFSLDQPMIEIDRSQFPLKIIIDEYTGLNKKYLPGDFEYQSQKQNCDNYNNGSFDRVLEKSLTGDFYEYSAKDAISCEYLYLKGISPGASYLININANNIAGKSLDICVESVMNSKCLLSDRLQKSGDNKFILPGYSAYDAYGIGIGNHSIGQIESVNRLFSIETSYIPYFYLKNISVSDKADVEISAKPVKLINSQKITSYKYSVLIDNSQVSFDNGNTGLLELSQSYEKGWGLYDASLCKFGLTMPFMCKRVDSEHVLVRNWANGWVIPNESSHYLIIFWPQYLQYLGEFLVVVFTISTFVSLLVIGRRRQKAV